MKSLELWEKLIGCELVKVKGIISETLILKMKKKLTYWVVYALNKLVYLWTLTAVKFVLKWHGLVLKKKYASKGNDIN